MLVATRTPQGRNEREPAVKQAIKQSAAAAPNPCSHAALLQKKSQNYTFWAPAQGLLQARWKKCAGTHKRQCTAVQLTYLERACYTAI